MSTTQPEALRENHTAADMATAAAQGFRDGVASAAASAGSEPVAWLVCTEEGDPSMVFLDRLEACQYCEDDDPPKPLYTHPSPPEGAGWKWVPKILSAEMVDAWASARLPGGIAQMTDDEANRAVAQANWDSMIAAAPPPPAQAADSVLEDAARYRHLRDVPHSEEVRSVLSLQQNAVMDKVIDKDRAAMAAKRGGQHD